MAKEDPRITREEQARTEVGQTQVSPALAAFLALAFLGVILAVPLVEQWHSRANPVGLVPTPREAVKAFSERGLWDGFFALNAQVLRSITAFETALKQRSVVAETIMPPMHRLLIGEMRAGNENAYCGRDGWLFFRPGVEYLTGYGFLEPTVLAKRARRGDETHEAPQPDPIRAILQFRDQLAERGIALIVMPAPDKAALYPEKLSARYDGRSMVHNPSYAEFERRLAEEKVLLCDAAPALLDLKIAGTPIYHATDTHWTPEGMQAAAQALAECLRSKIILPPCTPVTYTRKTSTLENYGDITVMLKLPEGQTFYPKEKTVVSAVHTADDALWQSDSKADILFLGDSFANIYSVGGMGWGESAGLTEQVSAMLERPVDAIRINDNGAYATRRELSRQLARGEDRLAGKKVVVWEFAARELAVGDWRLDLPLNLGAAAQAQEGPGREPGSALHVRAKLKNKSPVPTLEDLAPYTENLTVLEYEIVQILQGNYPSKTLYVAHWGVLEGAHVPWTQSVQPGVEAELWLEPLADNPQLASVNLSDSVMTDFSLPLFFDAGGLALGKTGPPPSAPRGPEAATPQPLQARNLAAPVPLELTPLGFSELKRLHALRDKLGGWDAWLESLRPFQELLQARIGEQQRVNGKADVFVGADRFLFSVNRLKYLLTQGDTQAMDAAVECFTQLSRDLAARGIRTLVVPVPSNEEVYPDKIVNNVPDHPVSPLRAEFMARLLENQVETLDLMPAYEEARKQDGPPLCRENDPHWDSRGIQIAAQRIVERLRVWGCGGEIPYTLKKQVRKGQGGTLLKGLSEADARNYVNSDMALEQVLDAGGTPYSPPESAGVVVLGDSYVAMCSKWSAGIAAHLAAALGEPVGEQAVGGGGPGLAQMLARKSPDFFVGRKAFVLCFAGRYLEARNAKDWRPVALPAVSAGGAKTEPEAVPLPKATPAPNKGSAGDEKPAMQRQEDIAAQLQAIRAACASHGGWEAWRTSLEPFYEAAAKLPNAPYVTDVEKGLFLTQDGYLFSREWDCGYLLCPNLVSPRASGDRPAQWAPPIDVMADLDMQLHERGIDLIVVPIPPRGEVEPDKLIPGAPSGQEVAPQRLQFLEALLERGIETIDLLPSFQEAQRQGQVLSLKKDSHYTNLGAQLTAAALAQRLRRYDFAQNPKNPQDYVADDVDCQLTISVARYTSKEFADKLGQKESTPAKRIRSSDGAPFKPDPGSPVLLVGDSYTYVYDNARASLAAQLSKELGFPVAHIGMGAGGPGVPRRLAQLGPGGLAKHRVVVWAFVARYLSDNTANFNQWEKIRLP